MSWYLGVVVEIVEYTFVRSGAGVADHVERDTRLGEHLGGDAPLRGEQRGQKFHRRDRTGAGDSIDNDASSLCGRPFEHGNYLPFSRSERSIDSDCADAYFLWTA